MIENLRQRDGQSPDQKAPRWFLAFDIGGTYTKSALVSDRGQVVGWSACPTPSAKSLPPIDYLLAELRRLEEQAPMRPVGVAGAVAGFLDEAGALLYNPNLPGLEGVGIRAELLKAFGLPIALETDANAACAGEYIFGSGQESRRFLCLTGGTGLGAGMIVDGRLVRPAFGGLGDAGHVIVASDGPLCSCGGHGCAEVVLSTQTLADQYGAVAGQTRSFRDLAEAATVGEVNARSLLEQAGHSLGVAMASLANIFFPDRIAIAGGLCAAGNPLLRAAIASFRIHGGTLPVSLTTVVFASAGSNAPLLGAVACLLLAEAQQATRSDERCDVDSSPPPSLAGMTWLADQEDSNRVE